MSQLISLFRSLWFAFGLIIFGVLILYMSHNDKVTFAALNDHGKTAAAKITDIRAVRRWFGRTSYLTSYIDIQFTTEDGMVIHDKDQRISREVANELRHSPRQLVITVRYLPESPHKYRCIWHAGDVDVDTSSSTIKIAGFMLLAGIFMLALRFFYPSFFNDE
jgi:hypothetical protein